MKPLLITSIVACVLGMFQYGYSVTCINQPKHLIEKFIIYAVFHHYRIALTNNDSENIFVAINGLFNIMGMIGALNGGWLSSRYGRKPLFQVSAVISLLSSFAMGSCKVTSSVELLVAGRALAGLSSGLNTVLVPLILNEVSPPRIRGSVGTLTQLSTAVGIFSGLVLGIVLEGNDLWPVLVMLGAVPAASQFILQIFNPESPTFLITNKKDSEAAKMALHQLSHVSLSEADETAARIEKEAEAAQGSTTSVLGLLTTSVLILPNILNLTMHLASQLSGISAVYSYSTSFFREAGISEKLSVHSSAIVGGCMMGVTCVAAPLMHCLGTKCLIIAGSCGMLLASVVITVVMNMKIDSGWVLVAATSVFCVSFALGLGPVPWITTAEIFSQSDKSAAMASGTFVRWLGSLAIVIIFPQVQEKYKTFAFIPSILVLLVLLVVLIMLFPAGKVRGHPDRLELSRNCLDWSKSKSFDFHQIMDEKVEVVRI